jgi:hypothetical protein
VKSITQMMTGTAIAMIAISIIGRPLRLTMQRLATRLKN